MDRRTNDQPLENLEEWEDDVRRRYPEPAGEFVATDPNKTKDAFRDYRAEARSSVKEFYRLNHHHQCVEFVKHKRAQYLPLRKTRMGIWEGLEFLNTLIDDSDPDTNLPQIEHLLQTAEHIRRDGHPRWFILTGLIHDLGKVLCLWGEPQWCVVGDTFPVGCGFSKQVVFPEFFSENPDHGHPVYQTRLGMYQEGGGLDHVLMSWGHDEYLYQVTKPYLPDEALAMIRYHSFYAAHRERDYEYLMNERDKVLFEWVRAFNPYDLYTKSHERPNLAQLKPFYDDLIAEFFPDVIQW